MLEKGWIGEKAGQGYYRREGKELMSLDLQGLGYRVKFDPDFPSVAGIQRAPLGDRLSACLELRDEVGEFLRSYLPEALEYANYLKEEISFSVEDFDRVMKWGFGWEAGPFETADMVGSSKQHFYENQKMLDFSGVYVPRKSEPDYKSIQDYQLLETKQNFVVRDMGDGVKALSTTTKLGVFTPKLVQELKAYLEDGKAERIVLTSEGKAFSAGFDLQLLLAVGTEKRYQDIDSELMNLQQLGLTLSSIPSVAAVFGYCLGGGFEMATSCSIVAASAESQIGLPEAKVGLIPGGGGTAHMRQRNAANAKSLAEVAKCLVLGTVSGNADEARKHGYLRRTDLTVYHPDRLWTEAKRLAIDAKPHSEVSWDQTPGPVGGMIDQTLTDLVKSGEITEHDKAIGEQIRHVFAKATSFQEALDKERAAFEILLAQGLTLARIKHMLETGKPLRN